MAERVLGAFNAEKLTAGAATAVKLDGVSANRPSPRLSITVQNTSGATLYLGGATVTDTTGYPLASGATFNADCAGGLYGYSVAGGTVNILEGF